MAEQKKSRKHSRNRKSGQNLVYKAEHRHEKGHVRRIKRHLNRYGFGDAVASKALMDYAVNVNLHAVNSVKEFMKAGQRAVSI
jgi:hypothetical protein